MEFYRLHLDDTDYFYRDLNNALRMGELFLREYFAMDSEEDEVIEYWWESWVAYDGHYKFCYITKEMMED